MNSRFISVSALVAVSMSLLACSTVEKITGGSDKSAAPATTQPAPAAPVAKKPAARDDKAEKFENGEIIGKAAANSKFAKLKLGMSRTEVVGVIGAPTDETTHVTGKAFIPFYFGGGGTALEMFYKGEGQLTLSQDSRFSGTYKLVKIDVNPKATTFSD